MARTTPEPDAAQVESAADLFREEQILEWSQYVAVAPIHHGAALAYNTGDPVPAANVTLHGYDKVGLVARKEG